MENSNDIITIKTYYSDAEADFAKKILEANGIKSIISGRTSIWAGGGTSFSPELQVKRKDAERAIKILEESRQPVEQRGENIPMIKREFPWLIKGVGLMLIFFKKPDYIFRQNLEKLFFAFALAYRK